MTARTIDITPTWSALLPAMLLVVTNGSPSARADIESELARMAKLADLYVASEKARRAAA